MAKKSAQAAFWRSHWFTVLATMAILLVVNYATGVFQTLENRYYDFGLSSLKLKPADNIALINIDEPSIANIGRWPWPRDVHAQLIDKLAAAKPKAIGYATIFSEAQTDRGLQYIQQIRQVIAQQGGEQSSATASAVMQVVQQAEAALNADARLAGSMQKAGNVVLPAGFVLGELDGRPDKPMPDCVGTSVFQTKDDYSQPAKAVLPPVVALCAPALAVGHLALNRDEDGGLRNMPMFVRYADKTMPAMPLVLTSLALNLGVRDIRYNPAEQWIQVGKLRIAADEQAQVRPAFYSSTDDRVPFSSDSFFDVVSGKVPASKFADKIVIIGAAAQGVGDSVATPVKPLMYPAEVMAQITSALIAGHVITSPSWAPLATAGALVLVAVFLIVLVPRLQSVTAGLATGGLFIVLLAAGYFFLTTGMQWVQLVFPALALAVTYAVLTTTRFFATEQGKQQSDAESAESNRMLGLAFQGQGQLDMAFDKFRKVPYSEALMDNLYNLSLDFERKRQFNKAQAVYEHMTRLDDGYKDVRQKLERAKTLSETVILGGQASTSGKLIDAGSGIEKPMLGRYQIEKELGKGAMGVVYLGKDPKIGRLVAIKTMALAQEFEGEELEDARERFFREAETAGRLQHPNIVTIFDAGEEHDLAYIAMELLKGKDLVPYTKPESLLPLAKSVSIIARVAEALDYAHKQSVVHRDIKPANVMYEPDGDVVKVTDFGIARITDASRTKTGLVLGTPSFMSPEQISGHKVDGRSDIYSLGVTLMQLITGKLPFMGDSMAELMYKIANQPAPDPRTIRADIPEALAQVVMLALNKRPDGRYQNAGQMAQDLRRVAAIIDPLATAPKMDLDI
jgi:serine/threonine-protein kinase